MDKVITSPLRYPGAKHWLFEKLMPYIPQDTKEIISPFFGGGSLEINLALRGVKIYGYDIFQPVVNFWQHWLKSTSQVVGYGNELLNLYSQPELHNIKKQRYPSICSEGELGASLYYALNRLSFSGSPSSHVKEYKLRHDGHYVRDWHNRPNGRRVFPYTEFWESVGSLPISVRNKDFTSSLDKHRDVFAFLDPPYPKLASNLYGDGKGSYHGDFDHVGLAEILKQRDKWILTYNDVPFVRNLYDGHRLIKINRPNDSWGKEKSELLIFSHDITEQAQSQPKQLYLF